MPDSPVVKPGTFPTEMLDQTSYWIGTDGVKRYLSNMRLREVMYALDYCFANATMLREAWAFAKRENYDTEERGRRWMIRRPAIRALMRRVVEIEDEKAYEYNYSWDREGD